MPQNYRKKKQTKKRHDKHAAKGNSDDSSTKEQGNDVEELSISDGKPYDIKVSDIMGRYVVASRNLKAGELVINDYPLAIGPCADSDPVCLGCYQPVDHINPEYICPDCKWPLCGTNCPGINTENGHSKFECEILKDKKVSEHFKECKGNEIRFLYEVVLPLRCLLNKIHDKIKWDKLMIMESHNEIRCKIPSLWNRNQEVIVNHLKNSWGIKNFTDHEIHTICGILEVNSFEIGQLGAKARGLYPSAYLLAHDCSPNTTHTDDPITHAMSIRVTKPLKKDEAITLSYAYTFQGTLKRREHLQQGKFFWCQCPRCTDPTELGTYLSAMKCPKCKDGIILSTEPLNQRAPWKCKACDYNVNAQSMFLLIEKIYKDLDAIDPHDVEGQESFLDRYRNVLTKDHYLCISAKYSLCQLYGRGEGFLIQELCDDDLRRKEQYCRDVLRVVDVLEPGLSRLRGVIMYELHAPIMISATRQFENKEINADQLRKKLREVVKLLKESEKILSLEPEGSNEYTMAAAAKDAQLVLSGGRQ